MSFLEGPGQPGLFCVRIAVLSMKFPKTKRLLRSSDFFKVRHEGISWKGHFLRLGVLPDPDIRTFQVGLVTSRKIGNAVIRNRTRRRLRAILQATGHNILGGHRLVVVASPQAAKVGSDRLMKEWKWLLHRSGLMVSETAANETNTVLGNQA